ncbi:MAG: glycosyltransferase [Prevotella sp.]|nr:glycosyltransferase [Prevotella sp.]
MDKIRVLEVIRQGQIGGGESHLLDLAAFLDKDCFEPVGLAFTSGEMVDRLERMGIKCHVIPTLKAFDRHVQKQIVDLLRRERIQIVHAHGSRAASNMLWPARRLKLPFVYTVHGWSFHDDQPWAVKKARAWSEKLICHYADRVVCVSKSNAETGRQVFGLKKADVIENGINLERFNPDGQFADLRNEFGFAPDDFVAGFIARCTKQKSPLDFLEAVRLARQQDEHVKGLFVGEGDMDAEVDAYIAQHQMQDYLYRSKFRTDVPDLLHCIDAYCLPSLWEGLSIALLEAMAMRKAIIATPTDGTKELLTDEQNGLVIPFEQPQQLADAICRLRKDKELFARCGQQAHDMVERRFNAKRVADSVGQIYSELKGK